MRITASPFYIAVRIKKNEDGFYRAFWAHRPGDCILCDDKPVRLRARLDKMGFLILA